MIPKGRTSIALALILLCALAGMAAPRMIQPVQGAEAEQAMDNFGKELQGLSADSLNKLGTRYFERAPLPVDSIMICYITAQSLLDKEQKKKDKTGVEAIVKTYINTAYIYSYIYKDYSQAYISLHKAEKICTENKLDSLLAVVRHSLAVLHLKIERIRPGGLLNRKRWDSYKYFRKAFDTAKKSKAYDIMSYSLFNYVSSIPGLHETSNLLEFAKLYLTSHVPDSEPSKAYISNMSRGLTEYIAGNYDKAIEHYRKMVPAGFPLPLDSLRMAEQRDVLIANAFEKKNDIDNSQKILLSLLDAAIQRDDMESELSLYVELYNLYRNSHNTEKANLYQSKYMLLKEEIASMSADNTSMTEIELRQTVSDYDNSLKAAHAKEKQDKILIISISAVGACIILILLLSLRYSKKRNKYIMALYQKNRSPKAADADEPAGEPDKTAEPDAPDTSAAKGSAADISTPDPRPIEKIVDALDNDDSVFDPDYQMALLCARVESNATYVSRAVNYHFGKSFKTVVTERRIREACRRFDNPKDNASLTIEAICREVGFRSRTAFTTAFRNVTGLTPSEYRRAARKFMPQD